MGKRISVKYKCGEKVICGGIDGIVTAVTLRGKGRFYEFSYVDQSGNPTSASVVECELSKRESKSIGFRSEKYREMAR